MEKSTLHFAFIGAWVLCTLTSQERQEGLLALIFLSWHNEFWNSVNFDASAEHLHDNDNRSTWSFFSTSPNWSPERLGEFHFNPKEVNNRYIEKCDAVPLPSYPQDSVSLTHRPLALPTWLKAGGHHVGAADCLDLLEDAEFGLREELERRE